MIPPETYDDKFSQLMGWGEWLTKPSHWSLYWRRIFVLTFIFSIPLWILYSFAFWVFAFFMIIPYAIFSNLKTRLWDVKRTDFPPDYHKDESND